MRHSLIAVLMTLGAAGLAGCTPGANLVTPGDQSATAEVATVAAKAVNIGNEIGGPSGFGGMRMSGYMQQMMANMGFSTADSLATPGSMMTVVFHNQSSQVCTFHLAYFSSQAGNQDQSADVTVPALGQQTFQMPCAEIVGLGSLETPGGIGCQLADGQTISNMMTVPGFLGTDYTCGSTYHMYLGPDTNDLNGNGDTQELIAYSQAMQTHMQSGGMMNGGMMSGSGLRQ